MLPLCLARAEIGGEEDVAPLAAHAVRAVQEAKLRELPGAQAGLLDELPAGQALRIGLPAAGHGPLREAPAPPADRVAVLLHEMEPAVLGRDDQREVGFVDHAEDAARAIEPFDLVFADRHPGILVDDPR